MHSDHIPTSVLSNRPDRRGRVPQPSILSCELPHMQVLPSALYLLVSSKDVLVDSNSERVVLWWHTAQELQKLGLTLSDDHFLVQPQGEQLSLLVNGGSHT